MTAEQIVVKLNRALLPFTEAKPMDAYSETAAFEPLRRGETVAVRGHGNSMTPLIKNGETVVLAPLPVEASLRKGDVVLAKVRGRVYLHRVKGLRADTVLIGNNHGGLNGWTARDQVVGRLATSDARGDTP